MRLLPFRATLVIMLIVANFVIAFVAVRNLADATTFKHGTCDTAVKREQQIENFWWRRAVLEERAARRGYTTQPDWHALAVGDREYIVLLRKVKNPACN
jgi:hypothetical protein